jgi:hypothetical protein
MTQVMHSDPEESSVRVSPRAGAERPHSVRPVARRTSVGVSRGRCPSWGQRAHRNGLTSDSPVAGLGSGRPPGAKKVGQLDRRPAGIVVVNRGSGIRRPARRSRSTAVLPPGFVVWKAATPPGLTPGAGPPPLLATLREPVKRVGVPATLLAQDTHGDDTITCMSRVGLGEGFAPSLRAIGTHQSGDPLPQVRDLVEVLVPGGVTGQLPQLVGDAAGAEGAGGV